MSQTWWIQFVKKSVVTNGGSRQERVDRTSNADLRLLLASVVQHAAGAVRAGSGGAAQAQLQEREQRGGAAAALHQVLCGGAVLQHGDGSGDQDPGRQEGTVVVSTFLV